MKMDFYVLINHGFIGFILNYYLIFCLIEVFCDSALKPPSTILSENISGGSLLVAVQPEENSGNPLFQKSPIAVKSLQQKK